MTAVGQFALWAVRHGGPNREELDVTITKEPDGRVRVKGNFSKVPYKAVHYPRDDNWEWIDVDPVLMLRRAR